MTFNTSFENKMKMKNGYVADLAAEVLAVMVCGRQSKMLSINLAIEEDCRAHDVSSA